VTEEKVGVSTRIKGITAGEVEFALCVLLLILGIVFYLWWGFSYGGWLDNGVYAVTITLVLFGLAGMLVTSPRPVQKAVS
jgi:hypothetical protein